MLYWMSRLLKCLWTILWWGAGWLTLPRHPVAGWAGPGHSTSWFAWVELGMELTESCVHQHVYWLMQVLDEPDPALADAHSQIWGLPRWGFLQDSLTRQLDSSPSFREKSQDMWSKLGVHVLGQGIYSCWWPCNRKITKMQMQDTTTSSSKLAEDVESTSSKDGMQNSLNSSPD